MAIRVYCTKYPKAIHRHLGVILPYTASSKILLHLGIARSLAKNREPIFAPYYSPESQLLGHKRIDEEGRGGEKRRCHRPPRSASAPPPPQICAGRDAPRSMPAAEGGGWTGSSADARSPATAASLPPLLPRYGGERIEERERGGMKSEGRKRTGGTHLKVVYTV